MKRPWTPGPWKLDTVISGNWDYSGVKADEYGRNVRLASKAPEMAELLIRLVDPDMRTDVDFFHDLLLDATRILKEVGWEGE